MDINFITNVLKEKISCISIKVIEKKGKDNDSVIEGLFKGIVNHTNIVKKEHTFILTEKLNEKNKYVIKGVNKEYYDILGIRIIGEDNEVRIFATKDFKDQERMFSILQSCLKTLIVNKMTIKNNDQLVDTALYTNVPIIPTKKVDTSYNTSQRWGGNNIYKYKESVKKPIKPTFFEFIPSNQDEINKMKIKLDLVFDKKFVPKLPPVNTGEEEKSTVKTQSYNTMGYDYNAY